MIFPERAFIILDVNCCCCRFCRKRTLKALKRVQRKEMENIYIYIYGGLFLFGSGSCGKKGKHIQAYKQQHQ